MTSRLKIPAIGIGAGPHCDGQVLVSYDMLGLFDAFVPSFVKQYANLGELVMSAAKDYAYDVARATIQHLPSQSDAALSEHSRAESIAMAEASAEYST